MANKALARRQKLSFRVEPSQQALKPRNPVALPATQRAAGPHRKTGTAQRQQMQRTLERQLRETERDKKT